MVETQDGPEDSVQHAQRAIDAAGSLVRQLRTEVGWNIAQLAKNSNVSPGLLSQIERGNGNPSLTTIIKLAQTLGVPASRFFDGLDETGSVVRAAERPRLQIADEGLVYELMTPHMRGKIGVVRSQVAPGYTNEKAPFVHAGEECSIVLEGSITISIDGNKYDLNEGDAVTFDSGKPHWYLNSSRKSALLLGAMSPPTF
ncbi:helix-turn-helix domain-containing protein [Paeniglutamicibacter antarcticus]|uniref:XRE family transcriptional regulator n=1 Tax=Paeniglutamicibacter antarcticus TaxID=494023 RepID=A0ABP9TL80_9MICC